MRVHAATWREGEHYVSRCVGADVASQGSTPEEAEASLVEAVTLSGVALPEDSEPPRLALLDAPVREAAPAGYDGVDPALPRVARWVAAGLTAYDATYVALAEETGGRVVTTDAQMIEVAPALATALA